MLPMRRNEADVGPHNDAFPEQRSFLWRAHHHHRRHTTRINIAERSAISNHPRLNHGFHIIRCGWSDLGMGRLRKSSSNRQTHWLYFTGTVVPKIGPLIEPERRFITNASECITVVDVIYFLLERIPRWTSSVND